MEIKKKQFLLEKEGYKYHSSRTVYFNHATKKMFSKEFIEDKDINQIQKNIRAPKIDSQWEFYFNQDLSTEAKQEILSEFGQ